MASRVSVTSNLMPDTGRENIDSKKTIAAKQKPPSAMRKLKYPSSVLDNLAMYVKLAEAWKPFQ